MVNYLAGSFSVPTFIFPYLCFELWNPFDCFWNILFWKYSPHVFPHPPFDNACAHPRLLHMGPLSSLNWSLKQSPRPFRSFIMKLAHMASFTEDILNTCGFSIPTSWQVLVSYHTKLRKVSMAYLSSVCAGAFRPIGWQCVCLLVCDLLRTWQSKLTTPLASAAATPSSLSPHSISVFPPSMLMDKQERREVGGDGVGVWPAGCGIMKTSLYGRRSWCNQRGNEACECPVVWTHLHISSNVAQPLINHRGLPEKSTATRVV